MDINAYYRLIWKRFWLVLLACLIGTGAALYYSYNQIPQYAATSTLALNPAYPSTLLPYQVSASVEALATSYSQFMRTRAFSTLVAKAMDDEVSIGLVAAAISTQYVPGTQFFKITATAASPDLAQQLANVTARVFIEENLARQRAREEQKAAQQGAERRAMLEKQRATLQQLLEDQVAYYQGQMDPLRKRLADLEAQPPAESRDKDLQFARQQLLETQNLSMQAITALVELQSKPQDSANSVPIDTATVVDEAVLPTRPITTSTSRRVLYALVLSVIVGIGGALLLEYLDYSFKSSQELSDAYGKPTLGVLCRLGRDVDRQASREKMMLSNPNSPIAEAFRMLRTNLEFACIDKPPSRLLVTSAVPSEGKTFTAINLAIAIAQAGKQVILVDSDLRKPAMHRVFGLPNDTGLSNLAVERSGRVEQYLKSTEVEGLKILTSGPLPPNPAEILSSRRIEATLRSLSDHAEMVIFDSPPITAVADAAILATKVDAILQVVRFGATRRDLVLKTRDDLARVGGTVLGPVLNMVKVSDAGYYYQYYHKYAQPAG